MLGAMNFVKLTNCKNDDPFFFNANNIITLTASPDGTKVCMAVTPQGEEIGFLVRESVNHILSEIYANMTDPRIFYEPIVNKELKNSDEAPKWTDSNASS